MSNKVKLLSNMIRKIVKEEMQKNFKSMMYEEIGRAAIQGKSLSFLKEEVDQKEVAVMVEQKGPNREEIRRELLSKLGIDKTSPMAAVYEDVDPMSESPDGDGEGVDPAQFGLRS